ncbi:MAG TPA: hypothetical protein DCG79_05580 [Clostridiales bacterium]|nr:hypothetical protein [Clostridiales bacterium]
MLFVRWKKARNKKGITLVEMLAAVVITAILASVLSMMIVPVMNSYSKSETKTLLQTAATSRLNDIAYHLRGATGVYVSSTPKSFPDTNKTSDQYKGVKYFDAKFGFALFNCYQNKSSSYLYPELKFVKYPTTSSGDPSIEWASSYTPNLKLSSDDYQNVEISCPDAESFYFYVKNNPDGGNHSNVLEVHLKLKKGQVEYEGSKTIVCENLVINGENIKTALFQYVNNAWKLTDAIVSTGNDPSKWKKYYSVWFSRDI